MQIKIQVDEVGRTMPSRAECFTVFFESLHMNHFFRHPRSLRPYVTTDCAWCDTAVLAEIAFDPKAVTILKKLRKNRANLLVVHAHATDGGRSLIELEYVVNTAKGYVLRVMYPGAAKMTPPGAYWACEPFKREATPINHRNHYGEGPKTIDNKTLAQLAERCEEVMLLLREADDHKPLTGKRV